MIGTVNIKIKETSMSFTTLRRSGADVIDRVRLTRERVLITNYGKRLFTPHEYP